MRLNRYLLGLLLAVGAAALFWFARDTTDRWDFRIEIPYSDENNPLTEERLHARLRQIEPLVSQVVGDPIRIDRLRLVLMDGNVTAERELAQSHPHLLDLAHEDYAHLPLLLLHAHRQDDGLSRLGRYVPESRTIEVYPFQFEALEPPSMAALIDVVLAHELAHVWQHQRFGVLEPGALASTMESQLARAAMLEGSAEFTAREVARRLDITETFHLLATKRSENEERRTGTPTHLTRARWLRWAYGDGLRFVTAVHKQLGPEATWEQLFARRPTSTWDIEHPLAWVLQPTTQIQDLDGWADRFIWGLEAVRPRFDFQREWEHRPLLHEDVEARLAVAGLAAGSAPWGECRGGMLVSGTPKRGPLAGAAVLLRAWRFQTPDQALAARRTLEGAFDAHGPRAWAGNHDEDVGGAPRMLAGENGALVRASLVFNHGSLHAMEGGWAVCVHEGLLFEALGWRDGGGPPLLELLESAVRVHVEADTIDDARAGVPSTAGPWALLAALRRGALQAADAPDVGASPLLRDELLTRRLAYPNGQAAVLRSLRSGAGEATAWMTALGPAAGHEDENGVERGPLLAAALQHADNDVRRFALGAIAERRCHLPPWSADTLALVERLTGHEDVWIRSAAVRAAEALAEQEPLSKERIDALATDASPAVRASLAVSRGVLRWCKHHALSQLANDPHPVVKRAAAADIEALSDAKFDAVRFMKKALGSAGAEPSGRHDVPPDRPAALDLVLEAMMSGGSDTNQGELDCRIRRLLTENDATVRVMALQAIGFLKDGRSRFLPELVRALGSAIPRWVATHALCKGGLDLTPARAHLVTMLEHPWWRRSVLRVLAANKIDVPQRVRDRAAGWMESRDPLLRCAAALLLLKTDPDRPGPLRTLDESWARLPVEWRIQSLAAASTYRPGDSLTTEMRRRALFSPFLQERNAAHKSVKDGVYDEAYLTALLSGMERFNPVVAEGYWSHFLSTTDDLQGEDKLRAQALLVAALEKWSQAGRLPPIAGGFLVSYLWPDIGNSDELIAAIDHCLLCDDPSLLRYSLALLRYDLEEGNVPESSAVREALNAIYSLEDSPKALPRVAENEFATLLADREGVSDEAIVALLLRVAHTPPDDSYVDVAFLLEGHEGHHAAATKLIPSLLEMGTRNSVDVALSILHAAWPAGEDILPLLRTFASRALPTRRRDLQQHIQRIEAHIERDEEQDK